MKYLVEMAAPARVHLPGVDKYGDGRITVEDKQVRLSMWCRYTHRVESLGVLVIPEGSNGRQVHEGPLVPGPWGGTFALASVISDRPGKEPTLTVNLTEGSILVINGEPYAVRDDRPHHYPRLEFVGSTYADKCAEWAELSAEGDPWRMNELG